MSFTAEQIAARALQMLPGIDLCTDQALALLSETVERIALTPKEPRIVSMTEYFAEYVGETYCEENIAQAERNLQAGKQAQAIAAADPSAERDKRTPVPVQSPKGFDPFKDFAVTKGAQSTPKPAQPASPGAKPYPFAKFSPPDVV